MPTLSELIGILAPQQAQQTGLAGLLGSIVPSAEAAGPQAPAIPPHIRILRDQWRTLEAKGAPPDAVNAAFGQYRDALKLYQQQLMGK